MIIKKRDRELKMILENKDLTIGKEIQRSQQLEMRDSVLECVI